MSMDKLPLSEAPESYFEISLLDMGPEGAERMSSTLDRIDERGNHLDFTSVGASYDSSERSLTVYGIASPLSTSNIALHSLQRCAESARGFDNLANRLAS